MITSVRVEEARELLDHYKTRFGGFSDPGHEERVLGYAKFIADSEELRVDSRKLECAVLLHGIGIIWLVQLNKRESDIIIRSELGWIDDEVMGAIRQNSPGLQDGSFTLAKVLYDADVLDSLGDIGYLRWGFCPGVQDRHKVKTQVNERIDNLNYATSRNLAIPKKTRLMERLADQ